MDLFVKFIESDEFFPVLMLLMLALLFIFAWSLFSGNKKIKRMKAQKTMEEYHPIDYDYDTSASQIELVQVGKQKEQEQIIAETANAQNDHEIALVPIKKMGEKSKEQQENVPIISVVETPKKDNVTQTEKFQEEIAFVEKDLNIENSFEDKIEENVELPITKQDAEDFGNEIAFHSTPNDNKEINETIEIKEKEEYVGEKTEIFDFPDFSELIKDAEKENEVESEIIDAANKYIETIMTKQ